MSRGTYKIPKNLCQYCYEVGGRYIMDCYCILCEDCFSKVPTNRPQCVLCAKPTNGHKIDAKQEDSIKKISHFFQNIDSGLQKIRNNHQFQTQIVNRYCQHLENQLKKYQQAVNQLISYNPNLYSYFSSRVNLKKMHQTQKFQRNHSVKAESTIKPLKQYNSQIYQSRRTDSQHINHDDIPGIRKIGPQSKTNLSGNAVYKVPNLNVNTALRSSKRSTKPMKFPPEQNQFFHKYQNRRP